MQKISFNDDYGNEIEFIVRAKFKSGYSKYVALLPADEITSPTIILKVERDTSGNEILVGVEEDEIEKVKNKYEEIIKDTIQ